MDLLANVYYISSIIGSILFGMWTVGLYQTRASNQIKNLIYDKHEQLKEFIVGKIEYHERHDDQRFQELRNDIWEIRVRNAAIDGRKFAKRDLQPGGGNGTEGK